MFLLCNLLLLTSLLHEFNDRDFRINTCSIGECEGQLPLTKSFFCRSAAAKPPLSGRRYLFGGTSSLQATLFKQLLKLQMLREEFCDALKIELIGCAGKRVR